MLEQDTDVMETAAPWAPKSAARLGLRSFKQGNLLPAVLFLAGIGMVALLSLRSGPASALAQQSENETNVTSTLTQLKSDAARGAKAYNKAKAVVEMFHYQTDQRQIPPNQLEGNPFEFRVRREEQPKQLAAAARETVEPSADSLGLAEAMTVVKKLQLQSVLKSSNGATAMISNNLLTEGQVIQGWTVTKILAREVTLTWKDQTYQLKMP